VRIKRNDRARGCAADCAATILPVDDLPPRHGRAFQIRRGGANIPRSGDVFRDPWVHVRYRGRRATGSPGRGLS
jgi:hypothetical protein